MYQDIYRSLNKRASDEQLYKLAALVGMRKRADFSNLFLPFPDWQVKDILESKQSPLLGFFEETEEVPVRSPKVTGGNRVPTTSKFPSLG